MARLSPEELAEKRRIALERVARLKAQKDGTPYVAPTNTAPTANASRGLETAGSAAAGTQSTTSAAGDEPIKATPKPATEPARPAKKPWTANPPGVEVPSDPFEAVIVRAGILAENKKAQAWPFPAQHRVPSEEDLAELKTIADTLPGAVVAIGAAAHHPVLYVTAPSWSDVARHCRDNLGYDHLSFVSAADYPGDDDHEGLLEVHAQLWSHRRKRDLMIKCHIPRGGDRCQIQSLTNLWHGANWHEREAYDMFGITFTGHPFHKRIFMPDGWHGHPLLKDYNEKEQFIGLGDDGEDVVYQTPGPNRW